MMSLSLRQPGGLRLRPLALAMAGLFLLFAPVALAAADPLETVKATVDQVLAVLQDPALTGEEHLAEKEARIIALVEQRFDFQAMSQRTLGRAWRDLDPARRQRFVKLFSRLLENTYVKKIELYSGHQITYGDHLVRGSKAVVESFVIKDQIKTPLIYRMHRRDNQWLVYDVVIEGVSLVSNYRSQFRSILRTDSVDTLMDRLAEKVAALENSGGEAGS